MLILVDSILCNRPCAISDLYTATPIFIYIISRNSKSVFPHISYAGTTVFVDLVVLDGY